MRLLVLMVVLLVTVLLGGVPLDDVAETDEIRARDRYCELVRLPAHARAGIAHDLRREIKSAASTPVRGGARYDLLAVLEVSQRLAVTPLIDRTEESIAVLAEAGRTDELAIAVFALVTAKQRDKRVDGDAVRRGLDGLRESESNAWAHRALRAFAMALWPGEAFPRSRATRRVDPSVASADWFWQGLLYARHRGDPTTRGLWSTWRRATRVEDAAPFDVRPHGPLALALAEGRYVGPVAEFWLHEANERFSSAPPTGSSVSTRRAAQRSLGMTLPASQESVTDGAMALWSLALHFHVTPEQPLFGEFLDLTSDCEELSDEVFMPAAFFVLSMIEVRRSNAALARVSHHAIARGVLSLTAGLAGTSEEDERAWGLLALAVARAEGFDVDWGLFLSELQLVTDDCRYTALANIADAVFERPLLLLRRGRACDVSNVPSDASWEHWFWSGCAALSSSPEDYSAWEHAFADWLTASTIEVERMTDDELVRRELAYSLFHRWNSVFSKVLNRCRESVDR